MLQDGGVYPGIRPLEVLRLFACLLRRRRRPEALLDRVGLAHVPQLDLAPAVGR